MEFAQVDYLVLATRAIEARTRQERRVGLYDWIVYKRGSKARERKGQERKHRSKLYTILRSRDRTLPSRDGNLPAICGNVRQFASAVTPRWLQLLTKLATILHLGVQSRLARTPLSSQVEPPFQLPRRPIYLKST
jgi:hypothetical protein